MLEKCYIQRNPKRKQYEGFYPSLLAATHVSELQSSNLWGINRRTVSLTHSQVRDKSLGSGIKSATWGGPREKLSEEAALFRVVDQLWSWHILTVDEKDRATQKRLRQLSRIR